MIIHQSEAAAFSSPTRVRGRAGALVAAVAATMVPIAAAQGGGSRTMSTPVDLTSQTWTVAPTTGTVAAVSSLRVANIGTEAARGVTVWPVDYFADTAALLARIAPDDWPPSQRARAIYEYVRDHYYQWEAPSYWSTEGARPVAFLGFYGYGLCSDVATTLGLLFERAGLPTRMWNPGTPPTHVVTEVYYDGRWHMFDANWPAVFMLSDGVTVAGVEDLISSPELLASAGGMYATLRPIYASTPLNAVWPVTAAAAAADPDLSWTLLPGDSVLFSTTSAVAARDDNAGESRPALAIASGLLSLRVDAGAPSSHERLVSSTNVVLRDRDGRLGWEPADPEHPGELVVRVDVPYPIRDVTTRLEGSTHGSEAGISLGAQRHADGFLLADSDLASGVFLEWPGVASAEGFASAEDDGLLPFFHTDGIASESLLILHLEGAPGERRLELSAFRRSELEQVFVDWSHDGSEWTALWSAHPAEFWYFDATIPLPSEPAALFLRVRTSAPLPHAGIRRLRVAGMRGRTPAPVWQSTGTTFESAGAVDIPLGASLVPRRGVALHSALLHVSMAAPSGQIARIESIGVEAAFQTSRWSPARLDKWGTTFTARQVTPGQLVVQHEWDEVLDTTPPVPTTVAPTPGVPLDPVTREVAWQGWPAATGYELRLCVDEACLSPFAYQYVEAPSGGDGVVTALLQEHPALLPGHVRYWSVRVMTTALSSDWSTPTAFSLEYPPFVTIDAPASSEVELPWVTLTGTAITDGLASLAWTTSTGQGGTIPIEATWSLPLTLSAGVTEIEVTAVTTTGLETRRRATFSVRPRSYLLAEGATGDAFDTNVAIANHADIEAPVRVRLMGDAGVAYELTHVLPPSGRMDFELGALLPGTAVGIATEVVSLRGVPLSVERLMTWGTDASGAHAGRAVTGPSRVWYFAEGNAGSFDTYWLVMNPQDEPVTVTATFLLDEGETITYTTGVRAHERLNIPAWFVDGLAGRSFGATFEATRPIAVERAMYFAGAFPWKGGHSSSGAVSPHTRWYFAEGATGAFFDTFILLSNPNAEPAGVTVTYLLADGRTVFRQVMVDPFARLTVWADTDPDLAAAEMSIVLDADRPIVAERSMYWSLDAVSWEDGTVVLGGQEPAASWGLADVRTGTQAGYDTYILIANPDDTEARVRVRFHGDGLPDVVRTFRVQPHSRRTIGTAIMLPELSGRRVAAAIEGLDGAGVYVESSMYWSAGGRVWSTGVVRSATPLPVPDR